VIKILTLISSQLKMMTTEMIGDNGVLILYGIDRTCNEVKEIISPPNPITEFYYQCTRRFEVERFETLFTTKPDGHVILICGTECLIYQYNGLWKKIKTITANLTKRQKNGGQSALRFSRLAEESRTQYITRIVDWINQLIVIDHNNYVFGSRELKEMLLVSPTLKVPLKTDDRYHTFSQRTINEEYFRLLMSDSEFKDNKKVEQIIELLARDSDYLLFSRDEVINNLSNVEYIVSLSKEQFEDKQVIILPIGHPKYGQLKNYPIIGKLYHKSMVN